MSTIQPDIESLQNKFFLSDNDVIVNKYICSVIFIIAIITTFLQLLILYILIKKGNLFKTIACKIQLCISVNVFIQQIIFIITSVYGFFNSTLPLILDIILGGLFQGSFLSIVAFIFLLTLNAFDIFYKQNILPNIDRKIIFKYGLYICYIWQVIITIFYMIPIFSFNYSLYDLGFQYQYGDSIIGWEVENKFVIIFLSISFILYIFIIIKIYKTRKITQYNNNNNNNNNLTFQWTDVKFIIQAFTNFVFYLIIEFLWEYDDILPQSRYTYIIINFLFAFNDFNNTILAILMISELRKEIKYIFVLRNKNKITMAISYNI